MDTQVINNDNKNKEMPLTNKEIEETLAHSEHEEPYNPEEDFRADFSNQDLHGKDLRAYSFHNAIFKNADLSNADLRGVNLGYANLTGANLAGAKLSDAFMYHAELERSDLRGASLNNADLRTANLLRADLRKAILDNAKLDQAKLSRANLIDASLHMASLTSAVLRMAKLNNAILKDADLSSANLRNADLQGAVIEGADLFKANLEGTILNKEDTTKQIKDVAKADPANIQEVAASQLAINSKYYENALQQSKHSFLSALFWASIGTALIIASIVFIFTQRQSNLPYLSFIGGSIVEVIAGLNFYLYGRASLQLTAFQAPLERTGRFLIANSICENLEGEIKQQTRANLVETIANVPTMHKTSDKDK